MERKARTILLNGAGWGAKKHPAVGEVFFLDFPLYRTNRPLERGCGHAPPQDRQSKGEVVRAGKVSARQAARPRQGIPAPQDAGPQEIGIKKGAFLGRPLASFTPPPDRVRLALQLCLVAAAGRSLRMRRAGLRNAQVARDLVLAHLVHGELKGSTAAMDEEVDRLVGRAVLLLVPCVVHVDRNGVEILARVDAAELDHQV